LEARYADRARLVATRIIPPSVSVKTAADLMENAVEQRRSDVGRPD